MTLTLRAARTLALASLCTVSLHLQADPVPNTWSATGSLPSPHNNATLTVLQAGEALEAGGCADLFCNTPSGASATYDPASGLWTAAGNMAVGRTSHSASLLANGQVLVSGGCVNTTGCTGIAVAEIYDPGTRQWTATGALHTARRSHISVRLSDGRVLVAGGIGICNSQVCTTLASAEIYDPQSGAWSNVTSMPTPRFGHVAVTLNDGRVLVNGGCQGTGLPCTAQGAVVYDPATNQWTNTGPVVVPRTQATATLLPSGAVIVAGGLNSQGFGEFTIESYDPVQNTWSAQGALIANRSGGSATLLPTEQILFAGGNSASAELYDPSTTISSPTASMSSVRSTFGLVTLQTGDALAAGGVDNANNVLASAELYHPGAGPLANVQPASIDFGLQEQGVVSQPAFFKVTNNGGADLIIDSLTLSGANPNDFVAQKLCAGGIVHPGATCRIAVRFLAGGLRQRSAALDIHDNAPDSPQRVSVFGFSYVVAPNQWAPGGNMSDGRSEHTSTLLADRRVLVAGGSSGASADLYDSTTGTWQSTGPMNAPRKGHTATLLLDGHVLVAGGGSVTAELYDPVSNTWSQTGSMSDARRNASAARLSDGRVLVAGGCDGNACTSADIYDPASHQWSPAAPMNVARVRHTATVLLNGRVLVAGGATATAELYDANADTWTQTGSMAVNRSSHTATRLQNGQVLVTGGCGGDPCRAVEAYNPATGLWTRLHDMNTPRVRQAATLLSDGRVLVEGGTYFCDPEFGFCFTTNKAEFYSAASDTWTNTGRLLVPREQHSAIRLPDGTVLVTGGVNDEHVAPFNSTEIFTP